MKKKLITLILVLITCRGVIQSADLPSASDSLTLKDCYQLAVNQSERLLIAQEDIEQAKSHRRQALGAILPNIHWGTTTLWQDTSGINSEEGGVGGTLTQRRRTTSQFSAKQPLFQGFKEFSAMSAYKAETLKNEALLMRQSVLLFLDVSLAFYRVLQLEQFDQDTKTLIKLTEDRIKELQGRVRLGKSRDSEVLSNESQLATLKSQVAANQGEIVSARDVLGYFIGRDARSITLIDTQPFPMQVDSEEKVIKLGLNRSDIRALQQDVEAKRYGVRVAKSGFYPYANLVGNYYTRRPGFQSEIDWDVAFNLDVPLFQGGSVKALTVEAKSRLRQSELALAQLSRQADSEIRQAHAVLESSIREALAREDAYKKAEKSYLAQAKEYRMGLVDNLQVLQAMNTMQVNKANYDSSYLQAKLNVLKLKVVTEELP